MSRKNPSRAELEAQATVLELPTDGTRSELRDRIEERLREQAAEIALEIRIASVDDDELTITSWHDRPNYHCRACNFASLSKRAARIHVADVHPRRTEP